MVFQVSAGFFIKNVSSGFQPLNLVLDNFATLVGADSNSLHTFHFSYLGAKILIFFLDIGETYSVATK